MPRDIELKPIFQCGECSILFQQFATVTVAGETHKICPNPSCHGPINLCEPVMNAAISWAFMHIIDHSGFGETQRMHLRCVAESQMEPWNPLYRLL